MASKATFQDLAEGWVFCGYAILLYKWERMAVLATAPEERTLMDRVAVKLRDEMRKKINRQNEDHHGRNGYNLIDPEAVILQTNGDRYVGPMLSRRFQVMESFVRGTYYIADHARDDLLMRVAGPGSDVLRFSRKEDAIERARGFTTVQDGPMYPNRDAEQSNGKDTHDMARAPKANVAAVKAAEIADKKLDGKRPPVKKGAAPAAVAAPAKKPAPAKKAAAPVEKVKAPREGVGALTKALIMKGWSTDEVIAELQVKFPEKANTSSNVNWYRNQLKKAGETIPTTRKK